VGDGTQPKTDVKFEFETTPAYRWMSTNAKGYGFELSFPDNNVQGVSFEPWHWRFINSGQASAVFSVAHTLRPS
jgi:D-alanyl-D-alanine carboxypeptidase